MIGNNFIVDSSIVIDFFGGDEKITARLKNAETVYLPSIVIGELFYGAYLSKQKAKRFKEIKKLKLLCLVLNIDKNTAPFFGEIKATLTKKGKPIPENDIWIAALALQHKLPVYTTDNHFKQVEGIKVMGVK